MNNLKVKLGRLELKNPLILASGTAGYGDDNPSGSLVGAVISKGLSIKPRFGNPPPRIWETPSGLLNSIGLENEGVEDFIKNRIPEIQKNKIPVIVNVFGETEEEYVEVTRALNGIASIIAIELNVSCPNVKHGGLGFSGSPLILANLTELVRKETSLPLIVKLPPKNNILGLSKSAVSAGAEILSLINSFPGMAIDTKAKKPVFKMGGGLCGPAIRPIALRFLWDLLNDIDIPVIAGGGIETSDDALQFILAGARAVTIGSVAMVSPFEPQKILNGMNEYIDQNKTSISNLIGQARKN